MTNMHANMKLLVPWQPPWSHLSCFTARWAGNRKNVGPLGETGAKIPPARTWDVSDSDTTLGAFWESYFVRMGLPKHMLRDILDPQGMVPDIWDSARSCSSRPAVPGQGLDVCTSTPMKLGALRPLLQWLLGCSSPGLQIFLNAHTVRPPWLGGHLVHQTTATLLPTEAG